MASFPAGSKTTELVAAFLAIAVAAGVVAPRYSARQGVQRDFQRLDDVRRIRDAIERYHAERGAWPAATADEGFGEWDVSHRGGFLDELVKAGYLDQVPLDPLGDEEHHYNYAVYAAGEYACVGEGPFYVLGISKFETQGVRARSRGWFRCGGRDWRDELAFVTGGGASGR